jgi:glycosyltransferase involved in cell wall biosynthesis
VKVHYILTDYRSFRRTGLDYIRALKERGAHLVETLDEADVVIIHDEAFRLPSYYRALPILRQRYVITYAVCESTVVAPDRLRWLGYVDEIWTSSTYCQTALLAAGRPVTVIPHIVVPLEADDAAAARLRSRLGLPAGCFVFYSIGLLEERKNIEAGIRAFAKVHAADVCYIVKSSLPLAAEMRATPGVLNPLEEFSDHDIAALHRIGHCYVSPHCAEGWGLCMSDAMARGNLVLATGYSGNMDFMDDRSALLARYGLETIRLPLSRYRLGFDPAATEPQWAYVDESDLGKLMMRARWYWDDLAPLREEGRRRMADYSAAHVGDVMMRRLDAIAAGLKSPQVAPAPQLASPAR